MKKIGFAGSFDPITNGHLWVIIESLNIADSILVMVAENSSKKYMFSDTQKVEMIKDAISKFDLNSKVTIEIVKNEYVSQYALNNGCEYLIRGIRNSGEFDYEALLQKTNHELLSGCKTIFLMPPRDLESVSSSFVKSLIGPINSHINIKEFLPSLAYNNFIVKMIDMIISKYLPTDIYKEKLLSIINTGYANRHYHGLEHILHCLQEFNYYIASGHDLNKNTIENIIYAILFHDIVYDSSSNNNEESSLLFFNNNKKELNITNEIGDLILSTKYGSVFNNKDEELLSCIDWSILGQSSKVYKIYVKNIRLEYSNYNDNDYNTGRAKFLESLLLKDRIYLLSDFDKYENQARINIKNEIIELKKETSQ